MEYSTAPIPAPTSQPGPPFELAKSFDGWLQARGLDYLDLGEGDELDGLRSEWLSRDGGEVDRLCSDWLRREGDEARFSG
jgi:hypothetical protein